MKSRTNDFARSAAVEAAAAVIAGRLGVIEGCRRLASLSHDLVPDWRLDEDFVVFGAVDSETDSLPTGTARQHWESAALEREDEKIERAEAKYRDAVLSACTNVLARFGEA